MKKAHLALPEELSLRGRRIVVTGAASGIGRATARIAMSLGADLLLIDRNELCQIRSELMQFGVVDVVQGDIAQAGFIERIFDLGPVHALAHCAAVHHNQSWVADSGLDRFRSVMDINARVPLEFGLACIEHMSVNGGGRIVMVGSAAGRHGGTAASTPPDYAASKGAVHTIVRWLSRQAVGRGVLVNAVAPGPVRTAMTSEMSFDASVLPRGRMAEPEEIGWAIAFLCTPAASYVSGAILDVNGGTFVG